MMKRKEKKPVPVIYVTSTKGSLFKHGSINQTLYFNIDPDPDLYANDESYRGFFDEMWTKEIPQAITNKFVTSQPLYVTNDKIPFYMFKSNIDLYNLKEFCKSIVNELSFTTGVRHNAQYGVTKTLFQELGKDPKVFSLYGKGDKLSRSADLEELKEPLEYSDRLTDNGIMCPFEIWKEEKRRERLKAQQIDEEEEIVTW